jgi:RHS repeat-associated protein
MQFHKLKIETLSAFASLLLISFSSYGQTVPRDITATTLKQTVLEAGNTITLLPGFTVPSGSTFSAKIRPEKFITEQAQNLNYIKTEEMLVPLTTTTAVGNAFVAQKKINYQYFDGLGRPIQTVGVKDSPTYGDMVVHMEYDNFGRQIKEYLPFSSLPGDGTMKSSPAAEQASFYDVNKGVYNNLVKTDAAPYKLSVIEPSPLNRILQTGIGAAWQPDQSNFNGPNNKAVKTGYLTNISAQEQIILWTIVSNLPTNSGYYTGNTLTISVSYDEENRQVRQYTDKKGQMILKKVQYVTGTASTNSDSDWAMTYYVYDAYNNLRFVLPPEFCTRLATYAAGNTTAQQTLLNTWCYQYQYDARNRMISKQVPGADIVEMVYDRFDRLVFTRDGNQRVANQWMFTKYDVLNRPVMTGITNNSSNRATMQTSVNSYYSSNPNNRFETTSSGTVGYSTNVTFPTTVGVNDLLTISFYDDYRYKTNLSLGTAYDFSSVTGFTGTVNYRLRGKPTGSRVKVLGTTTWLTTAIYYDTYYRTLQTVADDHKGNKNRITNQYYGITSWVTKTKQDHGSVFTQLAETDYDHRGRVLKTYSTLDSGPRIILASSNYNELGQLIEKNIHSTNYGASFLQSNDYRYNIRGWLTHINNSQLTNDGTYNNDGNDLFGMQLLYNDAPESINGTNTTAQYNGNVAAIKWSVNNLVSASTEKIYGFSYDPLNRLLSASYAGKSNGSWTAGVGNFNESLTYDKNGNILSLNRYGLFGGAQQQIDQLAYQYKGGASNQLTTVTDNSANYQWGKQDAGFVESTHTTGVTEMDYDNNGNLNKDLNKNITSIAYNHLNLPTLVTISGNKSIQYTYDAAGTKLKYLAVDNGTNIKESDYIYGIQYEAGQLAFVMTGEGRAVKKSAGWEYEYHLKDHLGNTRVAFGNLQDVDTYTATMEPELATTEEAAFKNIATTRDNTYNHTAPPNATTPVPTKDAWLNGGLNRTMGPAKSLAITSGDKLTFETYLRYNAGSGNASDVVGSLVSIVTTAFNVTAGENPAAYTAFNNYLPGLVDGMSYNTSLPKAYINYILLDANYANPQFGFMQLSNNAAAGWEKLSLTVTAPYNGYAYFYVSNESNYNVFVDDVKITDERTSSSLKVVQAQDYYPFGLTFNSYQKDNSPVNRFEYNGKELDNEFGLNWLDYGARQYDAATGRWSVIDPLSEASRRWSPYNYVYDNPIRFIDPDGMKPDDFGNVTFQGYAGIDENGNISGTTSSSKKAASSNAIGQAWAAHFEATHGKNGTSADIINEFNDFVENFFQSQTQGNGPSDGVNDLIRRYEQNQADGLARLGAGYTLLESGVGGDLLSKIRKTTMLYVNPDKTNQVNNALDAIKSVTKTIKGLIGPASTKSSELYISVIGGYYVLDGSALLQYNRNVLAPQILELAPDYYNRNIEKIFRNQHSGAGANLKW